MSKISKDELDAFFRPEDFLRAKEQLMCRRLIELAKHFYQDPKNVKAYKEWLAKHEKAKNLTPDKKG